MTKKEAYSKMQEIANRLERGLLAISETEEAMDEVIDDFVMDVFLNGEHDPNRSVNLMRDLKRKKWNLLLEVTGRRWK